MARRGGRGGRRGNQVTSPRQDVDIEVIDLTGEDEEEQEEREESTWMIGDHIKIVDRKYKFPMAPKFRWNCDRDIEIYTELDDS